MAGARANLPAGVEPQPRSHWEHGTKPCHCRHTGYRGTREELGPTATEHEERGGQEQQLDHSAEKLEEWRLDAEGAAGSTSPTLERREKKEMSV
jgi:hypothetical protein